MNYPRIVTLWLGHENKFRLQGLPLKNMYMYDFKIFIRLPVSNYHDRFIAKYQLFLWMLLLIYVGYTSIINEQYIFIAYKNA